MTGQLLRYWFTEENGQLIRHTANNLHHKTLEEMTSIPKPELPTLRLILDSIYDMAAKDINSVDIDIQYVNIPVLLLRQSDIDTHIEGNRTITISIKENYPDSYYLELHDKRNNI